MRFGIPYPWAVAALCLAAAPAAHAAPTIEPLDASPAPAGSATPRAFRDRVIEGRATTPRQAGAITTRVYVAADGTPIEISISPSFEDNEQNRAGAQAYADFLGSRLHGSELRRLRVFIGTPEEVNAICGGSTGVLACYARGELRMYVPSEDPPGGGEFTRAYAVTHE